MQTAILAMSGVSIIIDHCLVGKIGIPAQGIYWLANRAPPARAVIT